MKQCTGVTVFRVFQKTKGHRGEGAQWYCVECNHRTNNCTICKKWLCNIQMAVNWTTNGREGSNAGKEDPKYISISFHDGKVTGNPKKLCNLLLLAQVPSSSLPWCRWISCTSTTRWQRQWNPLSTVLNMIRLLTSQ